MPIIERRGENNHLKGRRSGELIIENLNKPRKSTRQPTTQPRAKSGSRERIPHISSEWRVMTKGRIALLAVALVFAYSQLKDSKAGQILSRALDGVGTITTTVNGKDNCVQMDGFEDCTGSSMNGSVEGRSSLGIAWLPETVGQYANEINMACQYFGLGPKIGSIFLLVESGGYSKANSGLAQGLMQITPSTYNLLKIQYDALRKTEKGHSLPELVDDIYNPKTSIWLGMMHISDLMGRYADLSTSGDQIRFVSYAYNCGQGCADDVLAGKRNPPSESEFHAKWVTGMMAEAEQAESITLGQWLAAGGSSLVSQAQQEMAR